MTSKTKTKTKNRKQRKDSVTVTLRVRPIIGLELKNGAQNVVSYPSENQLQIGGDKVFTFDFVFDEKSLQREVYQQSVKPLIDSFLEGYNATIIAYGQTGSGKTYTMGTLGCDDNKLQEEWGVIPSAISDMFDKLKKGKQENPDDEEWRLQCSFIEIYNEEIKDLLDPHTTKVLNIREAPKNEDGSSCGGSTITISNLKLESIEHPVDMLEALDRGGASRSTGYTLMNNQSSRSHAIFTIHLTHIKAAKKSKTSTEVVANPDTESKADEPQVIQSKFHFVDLAGSERVKKTGATGTRFSEGISINCGLLALGNVIAALGDPRLNSKRVHVPFRNSKITRLLQDSLGGNARTMMIACISPAAVNMMESKSTLNYANRAKNIQNKAVVNRDPRSKEILRLRERVKELEKQLNSGHGGGNHATNSSMISGNELILSEEMQQQLEEVSKLKLDLQESTAETLRLQEKVKKLRMDLSEIQDKYFAGVSEAKSKVEIEKRKRNQLLTAIKKEYPDFNIDEQHAMTAEEESALKEKLLKAEKIQLNNELLQKQVSSLQKKMNQSQSRDRAVFHNLHDRISKLISGDFTVMEENIDPNIALVDLDSSIETIYDVPIQLTTISESESMKNTNPIVDSGFEHSEEEDEHDDNDNNDDEDEDVSMVENKTETGSVEAQAANQAAQNLIKQKNITKEHQKQIIRQQRKNDDHMKLIQHEQRNRKRGQQLRSEKYNREMDKTNRDITELQQMLKTLCAQRRTDCNKKVYYEKQVRSLTDELEETQKKARIFEDEKSKLNPNDMKKVAAAQYKIQSQQQKIQNLIKQLRVYKGKLAQIQQLQRIHREDTIKISRMNMKLLNLKQKKVHLQKKRKEDNKSYNRWRTDSEKTIKQLKKTQRDKNLELQRHRSKLRKCESALKLKTAALMSLKKQQRELAFKQNQIRNRRTVKNVRSVKNHLHKCLEKLLTRTKLFHKYKSFDRESKTLEVERKEFQQTLADTNVLIQKYSQNTDEEEKKHMNNEYNEWLADKLECEQRIEDTQSTMKYITNQMSSMKSDLHKIDFQKWRQLISNKKVCLKCKIEDVSPYLNVNSAPILKKAIVFLINQHLKFQLLITEYKKTMEHLKTEQTKVQEAAENEMRKKNLVVQQLERKLQTQQELYRTEQIKSATSTIDEVEDSNNDGSHNGSILSNVDDDHDNAEFTLANENPRGRRRLNPNTHSASSSISRSSSSEEQITKPRSLRHNSRKRRSISSTSIPKPRHSFRLNKSNNSYNNKNGNTNCNTNGNKHVENELAESKKMLTMFCSPMHHRRAGPGVGFNFKKLNQSQKTVHDIKPKQKKHMSAITFNARNTIQLTPYTTPLGKSLTKRFIPFQHQHQHQHQHAQKTQPEPVFGQRSPKISPLMQPSNRNNSMLVKSINPHDPREISRPQTGDVFSRLTNPSNWVGTQRIRGKELKNLKNKIRKQKDTNPNHTNVNINSINNNNNNHTTSTTTSTSAIINPIAKLPAINKSLTNQNQLIITSNDLVNKDENVVGNEAPTNHSINLDDENHVPNLSVFERLHSTKIGHQRGHAMPQPHNISAIACVDPTNHTVLNTHINVSPTRNTAHKTAFEYSPMKEDDDDSDGVLMKPARLDDDSDLEHNSLNHSISRIGEQPQRIISNKSLLSDPIRLK